MLDVVLLHDFVGLLLLLEYMGLHLVHSRRYFYKLAQIDEAVGVKVRNADGTHFAGLVGLLHGPIAAIVVVEGLVDQQQINIVGLELAQGLVNGGLGLFIASVGNPHFGGEEQLLPGYAALGNGLAHAFLVVVGLGRVNGAVTHADGVGYTAFALCRVYLIYTIAQLGHLYAVVQCDKFHDTFLLENQWGSLRENASAF